MGKKRGLGRGLDALLGGGPFGSVPTNPDINQHQRVVDVVDHSLQEATKGDSFGEKVDGSASQNDVVNAPVGKAKAEGSADGPVSNTEFRQAAAFKADEAIDPLNDHPSGLHSETLPPLSSSRHHQAQGELRYLPVEFLVRGAFQPRREFDPVALEELSESIQKQGLMQPIVVRSLARDRYEIIAGERRWRACQLAGMDSLPCLIKTVDDEAALAMALIENMQREDLNPMEEAAGLHRLHTEFELTHQQVAQVVGKSRSAVTNLMRLMHLQSEVKLLVERGDLGMGHARALLSLPDSVQVQAAKTAVARGLSVRQMESYVKALLVEKTPSAKVGNDPNVRDLENRIAEVLGARVKIQHTQQGKGSLVIKYSSLVELEGILEHIYDAEKSGA